MIHKNKTHRLYAITFASILAAALFIYSCSTDQYIDEQKTEVDHTNLSRILPSNMINYREALIDSIAASNEFWEFERSSQLLSDKFMNYTAMLSQEKIDMLMSNLNNDDYMEELIQLANLGNELVQLKKAKENLFRNTNFLKLNESERRELFMLFAENCSHSGMKMIKTRREGDVDKCDEIRQAAYKQAKVDYEQAVMDCRTESTTFTCYSYALAKYDKNKRLADQGYEECCRNKES